MTKNISLSDDAYMLLCSIKGKNESFSDVIKRLIGTKKGKLMDALELHPELGDVPEYEEAIIQLRKQLDDRLKTL
ncbi:MAG: antitoxin VapB family protein [Methanosarcinales archaeon]